jgi:two-component system alkaline phosphatase synthesis response regulator PhoP
MAQILFVEDDQNIFETYKMELELQGYKIIPATDGIEALEKLEHLKPDLVLLDLSLPKKDGLQVLSEMKSNEKTKNIPVVVLTNFATDQHIHKAFELGAVSFITKYSFTPRETAAKVKEIINPPPPVQLPEDDLF